MSADRVDKQWKERGLEQYSTQAILGSLKHYGVQVDEAGFKALASEKYPLEIAGTWRGAWKGKGQFLQLPYAAAEELSRRLVPGRATPMQVAAAVTRLVGVLARSLEDELVEVAEAFGAFDAHRESLPPPGERRDVFLTEFVSLIDPVGNAFSNLPKALAQKGRRDVALRFAEVQETLFPERKGCVTALVRAFGDDRDDAMKELVAMVGDAGRDFFGRYGALDALHEAGGDQQVMQLGPAFCDEAIAAKEWRLADTAVHLLAHVGRQDEAFMRGVEERHALVARHVGGH